MSQYRDIVSLDDIQAARERISGVAHHTPLDVSNTLADRTGAEEVRLKMDNLQRTGAYKLRGAYNRISRLGDEELERGVIASSAGNHAQGVAFAAKSLGAEATIVIPDITPASKVEATRGYGANVVIEGSRYEESYEHALELAEERDLTFVHPFNEPEVIAGQGTIGLEVLEDFPEVDTMVVAVGGGGLISGIATALKSHDPSIRVVGVQSVGCAHVNKSLEQGSIYERSFVDTITEGIAASRLEDNTFELIQDRVDEVVEVTDEEVTVALAVLAERAKTIAEAAGAVPTAALLADKIDVEGENVVSLISGGNTNMTEHAAYVKRGMVELGRYRYVQVAVSDWPDALGDVTTSLEEQGAELDEVRHDGVVPEAPPNRDVVTLALEGSGASHLDDVTEALDSLGDVSVLE